MSNANSYRVYTLIQSWGCVIIVCFALAFGGTGVYVFGSRLGGGWRRGRFVGGRGLARLRIAASSPVALAFCFLHILLNTF